MNFIFIHSICYTVLTIKIISLYARINALDNLLKDRENFWRKKFYRRNLDKDISSS